MKHRATLASFLAALLVLGDVAGAEVADDPAPRIREYTERAFDFVAEGSASYMIKRGGKPVTDLDLATSSGDAALEEEVRSRMLKGRLYRAEIGSLALPLGLLIGIDNFFGNRPKQTRLENLTLPPSVFAPYPADDWRSFVLSAAGAVLALYGAFQLGELVGEALGTYRPRYLTQEEARAAVQDFNRKLALELNLEPREVATISLAASPSVPPAPFPEDLPEGTEGSGIWALRQATAAVQSSLGRFYVPFLAYTRDIRDFKPGLVEQGEWRVLMTASGSAAVRDVEVTVPRHGGGVTWRDAGPEWTPYRTGTGLLAAVRVDSNQALESLEPEFVQRQVPWLRPGSMVVLYPFYFRLRDPVWIVHVAELRIPPIVGINARTGTLVNLARYR